MHLSLIAGVGRRGVMMCGASAPGGRQMWQSSLHVYARRFAPDILLLSDLWQPRATGQPAMGSRGRAPSRAYLVSLDPYGRSLVERRKPQISCTLSSGA